MTTKVLVFESDPAFAGELRTELGRLGLVAQVVDDGNAGLNAAAEERPDLILLSIELPRMNGFSVCNKLKKDPALKDVPLIIMSSDSSDETFEQHRKLRTRAEGYVHKPIAFGELLEHMRPYVTFDNGRAPAESMGDDAGIIIDDDIEIEDAEQVNGASEVESADDETARIDREVEAFADTAFDHLLEEAPVRHASMRARAPAAPVAVHEPQPVALEENDEEEEPTLLEPVAPSVAPDRGLDVEAEFAVLRNDLEQQKAESSRLARELGESRAEVERLEQAALDDSGSSEQVARLQREVDELRLKATSGAKMGGVSSREFLDLREALNKKDKEILGLRDQVTRKEKELLDASDVALSLEREKADQDDKVAQLEKDAQTAKSLVDSLRADKEQAAKRAEDFKVRSEKLKAELDTRLSELAGIQKRHEEELAEREAEVRAASQQQRDEREREAAAHKEALELAAREAEEKLSQALDQLRQEEQQARDQSVAKAKEDAEAAHAEALASREAELTRERDERVAELVKDRDQRVEALSGELERETRRLTAELARASRDAESTREHLAAREKELEEQRVTELASRESDLKAQFANELQELEVRYQSAQGELEAKHTTERRDLENKHEAYVMDLKVGHDEEKTALETKHRASRDDLQSTHDKERRELEGRVADLSSDLSARTEERETLAREVLALRDRIPPLEFDLAETKGELSRLRDTLSEQQRRNEAMLSRWNLNRTSLEQAKDAIAAAVAQIEEAEVRGLE